MPDNEKPENMPLFEAAKSAKQQVVCAWCKWTGDSPVKKILREPGRDYPLYCRQCGGVGLEPVGNHV